MKLNTFKTLFFTVLFLAITSVGFASIEDNKEGEEDYEAKFEDLGRSEEDNAEEVESYTTNIGITETLEKSLIEVNDALDRIEAGTYGKCDACKESDIRIERLNAYPAARLCMNCAEKE